MTEQEASDIYNELAKMFGDKLPDPEHSPKEFEYFIKLYLYEKKVNESRRSI